MPQNCLMLIILCIMWLRVVNNDCLNAKVVSFSISADEKRQTVV